MSRRAWRRQRGEALSIAVLAVFCFFVVSYVLIGWAGKARDARTYLRESAGLHEVAKALTQYARVNQANFKAGKEIMYVHDQYAPDIDALQRLGFLSVSGPEVSAPWGSKYLTKLTLKPSGAIEGLVYLEGNVRDAAGNPDRAHACQVARQLGDIGLCTPPGNAAVLGNMHAQVPNPGGGAGALGALVAIPP